MPTASSPTIPEPDLDSEDDVQIETRLQRPRRPPAYWELVEPGAPEADDDVDWLA